MKLRETLEGLCDSLERFTTKEGPVRLSSMKTWTTLPLLRKYGEHKWTERLGKPYHRI